MIETQNDLLLKESKITTEDLANCNFECGLDCLEDSTVVFSAKDVCLRAHCGCEINLFYDAKKCDIKCSQNCLLLPFERANSCYKQCGCGSNSGLSLAAVEASVTPKNFFIQAFIFTLVVTFIGSLFYTLRRAKKQSTKSQLIKTSELKKQRKEKILDEE